MPTTTSINISVSDTMKIKIKQRAKKKGYEKISEYVRELFRADLEAALKEEKQSILSLENLLLQRLGSTKSQEFDWKKLEATHAKNLKSIK